MTDTLQKALVPLFTIGSICSLCLFEYPLGRPRRYLSCLYALAIWSYLVYNIYYPFFIFYWQRKQLNMVNTKMWIPVPLIPISLYRFKELKMCLHELSILDDTLEALGAPKEYQRLRNWIIQIIIGWIAFVFSDVTVDSVYSWFFYDENFAQLLYKIFFELYPTYTVVLSILICGTVLGYTRSRFNQVNNRLYVLYFDLFENNVDYRRQNRSILVRQRITGAKDCKQFLWIIMDVHLQLCLISRKLNKVFNIQMLLHVLWYSIETTFAYISAYVMLKNERKWTRIETIILYVYSNIYFILCSIVFLTLNYVCQNVYDKISETVAILHKLSNYNLDEDLRELVNNYNKFLVRKHA